MNGLMLQIHYVENGAVEIYSRNAECTTGKFPDVAGAIGRYTMEMSDFWYVHILLFVM